jgi:hypothetical protein
VVHVPEYISQIQLGEAERDLESGEGRRKLWRPLEDQLEFGTGSVRLCCSWHEERQYK